jgi:hypothetical protein
MASGTFTPVGQSNTYVKSMISSGLVVSFSRNPKKFRLPNYTQIIPVTKDQGYYMRIDAAQSSRLLNSNLDQFKWTDGSDRPVLNNNGLEFRFEDYRTHRYNYGQQIGDKARKQADFNIEANQEAIQAQMAMTARTQIVHSVLANTANWDATHVKDVTTIAGVSGNWAAATTANQNIKRSLNHAANLIMLDTNSVVQQEDLRLILSPTVAFAIGQTQEIVDHVKGSPDALSSINQEPAKWSRFGLPNKLYGYEIVVEDAVKTTSARGSTAVKSYVMGDGIAYFTSQIGGLVGGNNGPNFSTFSLFAYEEMTVEKVQDPDNRRMKINVVDDIAAEMIAPVSGFYFQAVS